MHCIVILSYEKLNLKPTFQCLYPQHLENQIENCLLCTLCEDRELSAVIYQCTGFCVLICSMWGVGCHPLVLCVWQGAPGGVKHHNVVTEAQSLATRIWRPGPGARSPES